MSVAQLIHALILYRVDDDVMERETEHETKMHGEVISVAKLRFLFPYEITPSNNGGYDYDFIGTPPDRVVCSIANSLYVTFPVEILT